MEAELDIPRSYSVTFATKSLQDRRVRFQAPTLTLRVSDDDQDGILVVTDAFSSIYGEGGSETAAINDYLANLVEHFLDLEEQESILAPGLQRDLANLRRYLVRTK